MLRIGIVAGEVSGDLLGGQLIKDIKREYPDIELVGIGGKQLIKQGCHSLFDMQILSITGITEIFGKLFAILRIRKQLINYFLDNPPDVFIGIDAPEFNLTLEKKLRAHGIKVVHYVSPSVWAWRESRLKKISRAVDLMLVIFPFELRYYQKTNIAVQFVGHPLAKQLSKTISKHEARTTLGIPTNKTIIALMPGSRVSELNHHVAIFLQTALWCQQRHENIHFVTNVIDQHAKEILSNAIGNICPQLPISIFIDNSICVMQASDVLLLASGTITLEAMLLNKPMVIAYRLSWLSYQIIKRLIRVDYITQPNLLADKLLVPEYVQYDCTPEKLGAELLAWLGDPDAVEKLKQEFTAIHQSLIPKKQESAADAVLSLINSMA